MARVVEAPDLRGMVRVFRDREHAGELLAQRLKEYEGRGDAIILAIPAGGVQVAAVLAGRLGLPMDLAVTMKLHIPWNREAGFGAVSWDGSIVVNEPLVASLGLTEDEVERCIAEENEAIERRMKLFRGDRPLPNLEGRTAIVVDDGLASGFSMLVTAGSLRRKGAREIVVAVPTAPVSAINLLKPHVDRVVCLNVRSGPFFAVADAYEAWYDLTDEDVMDILKSAGLSPRT